MGHSLQQMIGDKHENALAEEKVAAFGGTIPMHLLNEKRPTQDVTFTSDFPSERAPKALARLHALVAP